MCIRDSILTVLRATKPQFVYTHNLADKHDTHVGVALRVIAVSYTHLRAHETVLDLVCRLLLEKKKTNWLTL